MLTFSLNHDRRPLNESDEPATDSDFVTLRLWASHAQETLQKLRAAAVFPHGVSIRGGHDPRRRQDLNGLDRVENASSRPAS
jgi:type I restriction-modification system DNA methylase subunit